MMSRLFLQLLLCSLFVSLNVSAKTFREALDECAGQNTPKCNKIRRVYNKRKAEMIRKKQELMDKSVKKKELPAANIAERKQEQLNNNEVKIEEKEESPWSLGYFSSIDGIGRDDDQGEPAIEMYHHFDLGYAFKNGLIMYIRTPFVVDFSTKADEDTFTALDPYGGIKGNLWKGEKFRFWSRVRLGIPVSQDSVDRGITSRWGLDNKIIYDGDWASVYLAANVRGQFFGFGTDEERNNGSLNFELGIEGIKLSEKLALYFYYNSGFSRKIGRDLGYLVFNDNSQEARMHIGYDMSSFMSIVPGIAYNIDTQETQFSIWLWGSIF